LLFCTWDGEPLLWTYGEAWRFTDGKWCRTESAAAGTKTRPIFDFDEIESARLIETLRRMVRERNGDWLITLT
jgi:hypothetical protein